MHFFSLSAYTISIIFSLSYIELSIAAPITNSSTASSTSAEPACRNYEEAQIYPVATVGDRRACPSADSRVIFVSSSTGNDQNNGFSEARPKRSISAAWNLVREGMADWVVLKRGDVWTDEPSLRLSKKGRSASNPIVLSAYGRELNIRPRIEWTTTAFSIFDASNLSISGLHVYSEPGVGGTGFRVLAWGASRNLSFEDNMIQGFQVNIVLQGVNEGVITNVRVIGNIIVDAASGVSPGGHSQGLYASRVFGLEIINNVFDHNGFIDRDCVTAGCDPAGAQGATIFNHNVYLQVNSGPALLRGNIIARASSHGVQARSGGVLENNVFLRNPLNAFVAGGARPPYNFQQSAIRNNVVLEGVDINSTTPRGFGFDHNSAYFSFIEDNIIAHLHPSTSDSNNNAIKVLCGDTGESGLTLECSTEIRRNIVFNWATPAGRGTDLSVRKVSGDQMMRRLLVENNFFGKTAADSGAAFITYAGGMIFQPVFGHTFRNNFYAHPMIHSPGNYGVRFKTGVQTLNFNQWRSTGEPSARGFSSVSFTDSCRTAATYYDDVILGNTANNNCMIMHNDALFEAFMLEVRKTSRFSTQSNIQEDFLRYIQEGFRN